MNNTESQEKPCTCDANEDSIESCERHGKIAGHTPTPWHIQRNTHTMYIAHNKPRPDYTWRDENHRHDHYVITPHWRQPKSGAKRGTSPAWYDYPAIVEANAHFIVEAVNCHDDLLEACRQAYYSMAKDGGKYIVMAPEKLIAMLESALEKAGAK